MFGTVASLSWQVMWGPSEYGGGVNAVVTQADRRTFLVRGGSAGVVNKVQLFAEVVEGETHNIEEVPMDVLNQHSTESLNTIAASLIPDTQTQATSTLTLIQKHIHKGVVQ